LPGEPERTIVFSQRMIGHAKITVTPYTYAVLYDDELDIVASALDALDDGRSG